MDNVPEAIKLEVTSELEAYAPCPDKEDRTKDKNSKVHMITSLRQIKAGISRTKRAGNLWH